MSEAPKQRKRLIKYLTYSYGVIKYYTVVNDEQEKKKIQIEYIYIPIVPLTIR